MTHPSGCPLEADTGRKVAFGGVRAGNVTCSDGFNATDMEGCLWQKCLAAHTGRTADYVPENIRRFCSFVHLICGWSGKSSGNDCATIQIWRISSLKPGKTLSAALVRGLSKKAKGSSKKINC